MDLNKIQKAMTRDKVVGFLESLGIDPKEVCQVIVWPNRVILERYVVNENGARVLDHLGPKTVESHFTIID